MATKEVAITVTGKVQKVNFRKSTQEVANRLGITGTVQNVGQDTVQMEASGQPEQIDQFIEWCKTGPEHAAVTHVEVRKISQRNFTGFVVVRNKLP